MMLEQVKIYLPYNLTASKTIWNAGVVSAFNVRHTSDAIKQSMWCTSATIAENSNEFTIVDLGGSAGIKRSQCEDNTNQVFYNTNSRMARAGHINCNDQSAVRAITGLKVRR